MIKYLLLSFAVLVLAGCAVAYDANKSSSENNKKEVPTEEELAEQKVAHDRCQALLPRIRETLQPGETVQFAFWSPLTESCLYRKRIDRLGVDLVDNSTGEIIAQMRVDDRGEIPVTQFNPYIATEVQHYSTYFQSVMRQTRRIPGVGVGGERSTDQ